MTLVTRSPKRKRVYQRKFDHDVCWTLWNSNRDYWTYPRLAEHFGVSQAAISRVIDLHVRQRMDDTLKAWTREHRREPCKGGCGRLVWMTRATATGYCADCRAAAHLAANVAADTLRCSTCGAWKTDDDFHRNSQARTRRGRRQQCKACAAATQKAQRQERKTGQRPLPTSIPK